MSWLGWMLLGYLCGSVPFGVLLGLARGVDVRRVGSGNVGATNVGRALGRRWGALCFALDLAKGLLPVLAAGWHGGCLQSGSPPDALRAWAWLGVAMAAVLGHMFPPWLGFRGGKGVATGLGAILGLWPTMTGPAIAAAAIWLSVLFAFGQVSLASMLAVAAVPILIVLGAVVRAQPLSAVAPFVAVGVALALLIVIRHRANITRIRLGTEPKIRFLARRRRTAGGGASPADPAVAPARRPPC